MLNRAINAAFDDAGMLAHLAASGGTVLPGSPADFSRLMAEETEKWAKLIKAVGGRPD